MKRWTAAEFDDFKAGDLIRFVTWNQGGLPYTRVGRVSAATDRMLYVECANYQFARLNRVQWKTRSPMRQNL